MDWGDFSALLTDAGRKGLREFLRQASVCLVDIIGLVGDCIIGYEQQWFDDVAIPFLDKF